MKLKTLLAVSMVVNLALLSAVVHLRSQDPSPTQSTEASPPPRIATPSTTTNATQAAATFPAAAPAQPFDWRMVESADYRKYIANLRAIGCPEETIRDIIVADVNKLFESRRQELNASAGKKFEYWKPGNPLAGVMDPDKIARQQELAKEKRAVLKDLLGTEPEEKFDIFAGVNPFETMLDFLPAAKQNQVLEIYQEFQAKMMKEFSGGRPDAEDMKRMQEVQKGMESQLASILTPAEFEGYQLRMSQTAMMMRMQMTGFEPSEQEFRDIFKLRKQFDDEFSMYGMASQDKEERQKREAAEREMKENVKSLLGESRYAEYERAQDWAFQGIAKVAERQGLPMDSAVKVYDMKKLAEEQAAKLRNDSALTADQRTQALRAVRSETERAIQEVFGEKGWNSYRTQPGAYWLRNLSPDPRND